MVKVVVCVGANDIFSTVQREKIKRELVQVESNIQRLEMSSKVGQVDHASTYSFSILPQLPDSNHLSRLHLRSSILSITTPRVLGTLRVSILKVRLSEKANLM